MRASPASCPARAARGRGTRRGASRRGCGLLHLGERAPRRRRSARASRARRPGAARARPTCGCCARARSKSARRRAGSFTAPAARITLAAASSRSTLRRGMPSCPCAVLARLDARVAVRVEQLALDARRPRSRPPRGAARRRAARPSRSRTGSAPRAWARVAFSEEAVERLVLREDRAPRSAAGAVSRTCPGSRSRRPAPRGRARRCRDHSRGVGASCASGAM